MTEVGEGPGGGDRYERSPPPAITPSAKRFSYQDGRGRNGLSSLNDLATRRVTTARFAEPLTPPLTVERNKSQYQQHGRSTSSPTLSFSPRPFYHIGIGSASPLTPVKRQFQSPYLISRRRSQLNQATTDENGKLNADTDTKGDKPSGGEELAKSASEDKGQDQGDHVEDEDVDGDDDVDDDGGEGGEVAEDHDELNDTTESFELVDVYEGDTTYDFKDDTWEAFKEGTSHGLKDETGDAFMDEASHVLNDDTGDGLTDEAGHELKEETANELQDKPTDRLRDGTVDGLQENPMDGLKDQTFDAFKDELTDGFKDQILDRFRDETTDEFRGDTIDGFKDETGNSFASPLISPSIDSLLPSPGSGSVELVHESRERLIVRLMGLIRRISELPDEDELGNDNHPSLGALHIQVYEMEKILPPSEDTKSSLSTLGSNKSTSSKAPKLVHLRGGNSPAPKESTEPPKFWGSHTITVPNWLGSKFSDALLAPSPMLAETPTQEPNEMVKTAGTVPTISTAVTATEPTTPKPHSPARTPSPSIRIEPPSQPLLVNNSTQTINQDTAKFSLIASETNKVTAQLEAVFKNLQTRREESAHLHYLLVERAEAAAGKILELEKDIADLQEELGDNEGELKHLRLRMRAVETLCGEFVRCNAKRGGVIDPDLVESIERWKSDWAKLREKMAAKKNEKRKARRSDSGLGGMEVEAQDSHSVTASTVTMSSLGLSSPGFSRTGGTGRESGATTPTITTPIRTIHRRRQ